MQSIFCLHMHIQPNLIEHSCKIIICMHCNVYFILIYIHAYLAIPCFVCQWLHENQAVDQLLLCDCSAHQHEEPLHPGIK